MSTIDRYLVAAFLRSYLLLLTVGCGLYILSDLLVNLDEFTDNRELSFTGVLYAIVDYYGHNLPLYFMQLGGPVLAFAGAYTVAMLLRNNEMTSLVAAGVPLQRLAVPILLCAAVLVGLWMVNREFVLPNFAHMIARHRNDVVGTRARGIDFARDDNDAILTARSINLRAGRLENVVIVEPRSHGSYVIQADAAVHDPQRKTWRLDVGRRIVETAPTDAESGQFGVRYEPVSEYAFTLSPEELVLRQSAQWAGLLSLRQMNALLKSRNLPNLASVRMNRHIWLTQPLLQLLLLGLTLPFFLTREPISVLVAGGRALLLTGAFFGVAFCAHSMTASEHAALVAWIPLIMFGPVAVLHMANVRT